MLKNKIEKWEDLVEEMLAASPRLGLVQSQMEKLGVRPGDNLIECMELALHRLEPQLKKKILSKRSKSDEL